MTDTEANVTSPAPALAPALVQEIEKGPRSWFLSDAQSELDSILQAVADGVTVQDERGRFIYANAAAAKMAGFATAEEYLGATAAEISSRLTVLDAEGRPFSYDLLPARRALRGEASPEMLVQFRRNDTGEVRWSITRSRATRGGGGEPLAISIFHDMTERIVAERRLRFLAEAGARLPASLDIRETLDAITNLATETLADWAVVYLLEGGQLTRRSLAHREHVDVSAADELERRYPPQENAQSILWQTLRDGTPRFVPQVPIEALVQAARDPEHLTLLQALAITSAIYVPLTGREGSVGVLCLLTSNSSRLLSRDDLAMVQEIGKRAALALENARLYTQAQDAIRARDEFMSVASHELRTPVAAIKGVAQLQQRLHQRGALDEARLHRGLDQIVEQSNRLATLTSDLLDVSRLQTGQFQLRPETLDLVPFVRAMVETLAEQPDAHHTFRFSAEAPCLVRVDRTRLEQVLANLIENAIKYSPDGGTVEVRVDSQDRGCVIQVSDQGIGLPAGAQEAIFQPFGRASNAAERQIQGMGLGLYLCRQIVERHGGRIWAESPGEGNGTIFRVWLPAEAAT